MLISRECVENEIQYRKCMILTVTLKNSHNSLNIEARIKDSELAVTRTPDIIIYEISFAKKRCCPPYPARVSSVCVSSVSSVVGACF